LVFSLFDLDALLAVVWGRWAPGVSCSPVPVARRQIASGPERSGRQDSTVVRGVPGWLDASVDVTEACNALFGWFAP
jgi:hypothetical protein